MLFCFFTPLMERLSWSAISGMDSPCSKERVKRVRYLSGSESMAEKRRSRVSCSMMLREMSCSVRLSLVER